MNLGKPLLIADRGCPYAHRVRALLYHLGVLFDLQEVMPGQAPHGITAHTPSGRIPWLVHGEVSIGESRAILEHLADSYGFMQTYPDPPVERALHREAMTLMDSSIAPSLVREFAGSTERLEECLDRFELLASKGSVSPTLLTFHFAPIWLRLQWWRPTSNVTRAIRARRTLVRWLDAMTELSAVARTAPTPADNIRDFELVRAASQRGAAR